MNVQTIEWHKRCLGNTREYLKREEEGRDRMIARCKELVEKERHYTAQIAEAQRRGKATFDSERFMQKAK